MADEVKGIFKILIGTIVIIVVSALLIELFNVNIAGMQLRQMTRMAAKQAANLFTQETYKQGTNGAGTIALPDIMAYRSTFNTSNGYASQSTTSTFTYQTGNFYGTTDPVAIWDKIYSSTAFLRACEVTNGNTYTYTDSRGDRTQYHIARLPSGKVNLNAAYTDLESLHDAVDRGDSCNNEALYPTMLSWNENENSSGAKTKRHNAAVKNMWDNLYTATNIGIPYMDTDIMNKMLRYNLTKLLMNGHMALIQMDENGEYFVNYSGFRCYTNKARVSRYTYRVYDMNVQADRKELASITGMSESEAKWNTAYTYTGTGSSSSARYNSNKFAIGNRQIKAENKYVTVVGIEYTMPVSYKGITPIKRIFQSVWNREVGGFNGTAAARSTNLVWGDERIQAAAANNGMGASSAIVNMTSGGGRYGTYGGGIATDIKTRDSSNQGILDTLGTLQYTLIR